MMTDHQDETDSLLTGSGGLGSSSHRGTSPGQAKSIMRVLAQVRALFNMELAFVSRFSNGKRYFQYIEGDKDPFGLDLDSCDPLEESYCGRIVAGVTPSLIRDARREPSVADLEVTHSLPVGAHLSVPIVLSDGRVYGTLCCFSRFPVQSLDERDVEMLHFMTSLIVEQLEAEDLASSERLDSISRINAAMFEGHMTAVYQPIVDLRSGSAIMVEALARFRTEPVRPPNEWFDEAWVVGLGPDLELKAFSVALEGLEKLPGDVRLSINLSPETALSPQLHEMLAGIDASRIVIELTEHAHVADYGPLKRALVEARNRGVSIAIDDVGSGHSGLQRLLEISPDLLKLDISITRGLDKDPMRRSLAGAVSSFAESTGLTTVAEGVETMAEADALRKLRIDAIQGYLVGRPGPIHTLSIPTVNGYSGRP